MTRRRQLLDMVTAEDNRLEHASTPDPPQPHGASPVRQVVQ